MLAVLVLLICKVSWKVEPAGRSAKFFILMLVPPEVS